ncbi:MAG: hypothetical protein ACI4OX_01385 [Akkermansia sp.]
MSTLPPDSDPVCRAQAWIGDAVLALYVRRWILSFNGGVIDGDLFIEFTSNNFLRLTGNATGVEACIGRVYESEGTEAAFAWIEKNLRPKMDARLHILRRKNKH